MENHTRRRGGAGGSAESTRKRSASAEAAVDTVTESSLPLTVRDVLTAIDRQLSGVNGGAFRAIPLGFDPLDEAIGGGLHSGDLVLLAGGQGTGKTTMALQAARHVALMNDATCLYLCFEHDETQLLVRLLAMESVLGGTGEGVLTLREVQHMFTTAGRRGIEGLGMLAAADPRLGGVLTRVQGYQERLYLLQPSGRTMTMSAIGDLVDLMQQKSGHNTIVVVDYLQKIPAERDYATESDRIASVTEGLKDLALRLRVPVLAIAALDVAGLQAARVHVYHLWGGAALAYEADAILMLSEKADVVAKVNYEYNPQRAQSYRDWVVASLLKNRRGRNLVDMEFQKRFASGCFDPNGGFVQEKLIDERIYRE